MKPELKLFFDFEFTSLSPDAMPISLAVVSSSNSSKQKYPVGIVGWDRLSAMTIAREKGLHFIGNKDCVLLYRPEHFCSWIFSEIILPEQVGKIEGNELSTEMQKAIKFAQREQIVNETIESKSFYAEFSDFQLDRCDKWVKENVVAKLEGYMSYQREVDNFDSSEFFNNGGSHCFSPKDQNFTKCVGNTSQIKIWLKTWLSQFTDYNIQFVADCGSFDWYWMLQLLAEWEIKDIHPFEKMNGTTGYFHCKTGLPKLPENISPVPEDLNDLIAIKKGISVREAFELNREELAFGWVGEQERQFAQLPPFNKPDEKHNALFDARVIKATYEKLK